MTEKNRHQNTESVSNGSLNLSFATALKRTSFTKCKTTTPEGRIMPVHACLLCRGVSVCVCVCVCVCVFGRVVMEGVNSCCYVRSNWRGSQSFLCQTKSKQNNGWKNVRCRLSARPREEMRAAKTADNLIMSLRRLMFRANDYHMWTHKTREQIVCGGEGGKYAVYVIRPLSGAFPQKAPDASFLSL